MNVKTVGVSPKVYIPLGVGLVVGIVLILVGEKETGITLLLTTAGLAGVGAGASPGEVAVENVEADNMGDLSAQLSARESS
jgi:hypothetical protein